MHEHKNLFYEHSEYKLKYMPPNYILKLQSQTYPLYTTNNLGHD